MRCRRSQPHAFTLLELILVMVILAVLATIVAPHLGGVSPGHSANDTARQMLAMSQYAQSQAIAEGLPYRLNFDTGKLEFWLTAQSTNSAQFVAPGRIGYRDRATAGAGVARMSVNVPPQPDGSYVQFLPSGRTDPIIAPNGFEITLTDIEGHNLVVACQTPTEPFRILGPGEVH